MGIPAQMSSSSSGRGSKLLYPSQNSPRVALKQDVNLTPLKIHRVYGLFGAKIIIRWSNVLPLVWGGSLQWGYQLRCHPGHLVVVQNYYTRPKIVLVLL
ncbi:hypothetical protein AVEN_109607-1 [Araneus ventricosus]|uniref:Uncharacterized protein n=1 Tax=Araneus ventricosus TaxID=182803 RepID=A0A4Y2P365_ARAVE|nr:hypothetical protein AVEN_109607-1 [Araneus ventricosus]